MYCLYQEAEVFVKSHNYDGSLFSFRASERMAAQVKIVSLQIKLNLYQRWSIMIRLCFNQSADMLKFTHPNETFIAYYKQIKLLFIVIIYLQVGSGTETA